MVRLGKVNRSTKVMMVGVYWVVCVQLSFIFPYSFQFPETCLLYVLTGCIPDFISL